MTDTGQSAGYPGLLPTLPIPFGDVPGSALDGTARRDGTDVSYRRPPTNRREPFVPS